MSSMSPATISAGIIQALDKLPDARPFWCYAYFQGRTVLVPKDSHYKTVGELLSQGVNWADATKQAIGQMKGKRLGLLNEPSATPFVEFVLAQGGLTLQDVVTIPVENPKIVQLALASQLDFASPNGAAQIYQLQYRARMEAADRHALDDQEHAKRARRPERLPQL